MRVVLYVFRDISELGSDLKLRASMVASLDHNCVRKTEIVLTKSQAKEFLTDVSMSKRASFDKGLDVLDPYFDNAVATIRALFDCKISRDLPYYTDLKGRPTKECADFLVNAHYVALVQELA